MKNYLVIAVITLATYCAASWGHLSNSLLTNEDYKFQLIDNENGSAMSSVPNTLPAWQSFNKWQCFKSENLNVECVKYGESIVPSIYIETETQDLSFDAYAEDQHNCEEAKYYWQNLISSGPETCIYAALMPDIEWNEPSTKPHSLWYIHTIKGAAGYWATRQTYP